MKPSRFWKRVNFPDGNLLDRVPNCFAETINVFEHWVFLHQLWWEVGYWIHLPATFSVFLWFPMRSQRFQVSSIQFLIAESGLLIAPPFPNVFWRVHDTGADKKEGSAIPWGGLVSVWQLCFLELKKPILKINHLHRFSHGNQRTGKGLQPLNSFSWDVTCKTWKR